MAKLVSFDAAPARQVWVPSSQRLAEARITDFINWLSAERRRIFDSYWALWEWSATDLGGSGRLSGTISTSRGPAQRMWR